MKNWLNSEAVRFGQCKSSLKGGRRSFGLDKSDWFVVPSARGKCNDRDEKGNRYALRLI